MPRSRKSVIVNIYLCRDFSSPIFSAYLNLIILYFPVGCVSDALWDGYYGIHTSETNLNAKAVIETYQQLWKIEQSFRILKSTVQTSLILSDKRLQNLSLQILQFPISNIDLTNFFLQLLH